MKPLKYIFCVFNVHRLFVKIISRNFAEFRFLPRDAMPARYRPISSSSCLSVRPSICLSQVGVLLKRLACDHANSAAR